MRVNCFIVNLNFLTLSRLANYFVTITLLCKSGIWTINIFLKLFVFQSYDFNSHPGKLCLNLSLAQLIETLLTIVHHGSVVGFWININVRARLLVTKSSSLRSRFQIHSFLELWMDSIAWIWKLLKPSINYLVLIIDIDNFIFIHLPLQLDWLLAFPGFG
jgi:hypothetical protein